MCSVGYHVLILVLVTKPDDRPSTTVTITDNKILKIVVIIPDIAYF